MTNPTKIGRYEVVERVGRGGMGAVYRGRDTVLDREVAIKVMSSDFAADETSRPRFYREARAAAKLQHRNIVTIFEFGEEDDTPFIVMEFLRGQDLSRRIRCEPPLDLTEKLDIIAELCTGLHFAHEQGVIHRDVKPANIWLVPDGSVKLLDFGIAKFSSATMTRQGSVFGSISYMSPEQVNGSDVDGRADIFSAGVVLYELLSGKKPFAGDSPTAVLARIMDEEPASAADLPSDLPRPLVAAVMKALQKDRERRYRHAADFGADLRLVRSALTATAEPAGTDIDLAETTLTDTGKGIEAGHHEPAGSVTVARTATLDLGSGEGAARRGRPWLVPALVVMALVLTVGGGWLAIRERGGAGAADAATKASSKGPAAAKSVLVKILSEPSGAQISVNGVDTGRVTPAEIQVDPAKLPSVSLSHRAREGVTAQLTSEDAAKGSVVLRLPESAAEKPAAVTAPAETRSKVTLGGTGEYAFEVWEGNRLLRPAAQTHEFTVTGRPRLYLRNQEYFLNQSVQIDGRPDFEYQAPGLGRLRLIARETCNVSIAGQKLGEPPILLTMAAGSYVAEVTCDGQTKRQPFTLVPGDNPPVTVK